MFGIIPCVSFKIVMTTEKGLSINKMINCIIYIFAIISLFLINIDFWKYSPERRMSISYYMLPLFISIIIQFTFYDKNMKIKNRILKYILYFIIFYKYEYFYIAFTSRGAIISILICILICFLVTIKERIKKILYIILGIIIIFILSFYMKNIFNVINNILNPFNIYSTTLERTINLIENENVGNGRERIYLNAWEDIKEKPLFGNGIGEFYNKYETYPHNIVLQTWHEGGVLYMLVLILPIVYSIYLMIFSTKIYNEKKYLLIFLFSISVIRLMISYEYWKDNYFWIYLYIIFLPYIKRGETDGNSNNTNIQKGK